jgi:small subunit ribosomal protein S6
MMKEYESIFVLDPGVDDARVDVEVEKIREFITTHSGEITEIQKWGRRKLAYEVNRRKEGIYTLIRFKSTSELPAELNRRYRLNENMIRFLTVLHEAPPAGELEPGREEVFRDDVEPDGDDDGEE